MYEVAGHARCVSDSDGATVLDLRNNLILGLNPTGAFVWERLQRGLQFEEIVDALVEATNAERFNVEADTRAFIGELIKRGLLST